MRLITTARRGARAALAHAPSALQLTPGAEDGKEFYLLGVSFRTAPVAVREALSFTGDEASDFLREFVGSRSDTEATILSTCNRAEFYLAAPEHHGVTAQWLEALRRLRPDAPALRSECVRYQCSGAEAVRHLYRVACGLESAVLGDVQILGQVKHAMVSASESGALGMYLNHTFTGAVRLGRLARAETGISRGAASVGSALAGLLARRWRRSNYPGDPEILIIGAGDAAQNIGRHLLKRRFGSLTFVNRSHERAAALASECGGRVRTWPEIGAVLIRADFVIVATSAGEPVLRRRLLDTVVDLRGDRPLVVIDAGVPRNVEPSSRAEVLDIDAITEEGGKGLAQRRAAVGEVQRLVENELEAWKRWRASLPIEATIKSLYVDAAALSHDTAHHILTNRGLSEAQIERCVMRSFKHLLHEHSRRLRALETPVAGHIAKTYGAERLSC